MDISLLLSGVEGVETYIISAAIALARMIGLIIIMPAFTRLGLTGILRSGVALVFALVSFIGSLGLAKFLAGNELDD